MSNFLFQLRNWITPRVRVLPFLAVLSVAFLLGAQTTLQAAPVTFAFEAEVASVIDSGGGAGLPFTVAVGDALFSSFELDSFSGGPGYAQTGALSFEIAGNEFSLEGFLVTVENDHVPDAVPLRGSIADPLNTPIVDQGPGVSDRLSLSCDSPFSLTCALLNGSGNIEFSPQIALFGDQTLIDSTELFTDPAIWNMFSFREMSLLFRNGTTEGTTRIGVYIGPLSFVPEPTSSCLTVSFAVLLAVFVQRRWKLSFSSKVYRCEVANFCRKQSPEC